MIDAFKEATAEFEDMFGIVAGMVPAPIPVPRSGGVVFRYKDQTAEQAIVQKLARSVSGLSASLLLHTAGYLQESAVLHRTIDEFAEDIMFLCLGLVNGELAPTHQKYLAAFYAESHDDQPAAGASPRKVTPPVSRKEIRKAIDDANLLLSKRTGQKIESATELVRSISSLFSGFVHGGSPQVMDMYGGRPLRFHLRGMAGTPLVPVYEESFWNQFYRTAQSFAIASLVLGAPAVYARARRRMKTLELAANRDYGSEDR